MSQNLTNNSTTKEKNENTFVGIDVAKEELVLHILPNNEQLTVPNSSQGIKTLVKRFKKIEPQQIVLEATGGLERNLVAALAANGFAIVVVNPRQARDLAKGLGELSKTDAVDAKILARIAQLQCLSVRPITSQETRDMNDLVMRRQQLITMRTQEKNRLQQTNQKTIKKSIEKMIAAFDKQIALLDASIKKMIDAHPDWSEKDKIIQSVPGVGEKSSQALIAGLSELGTLNRREVAALVGTAPRCQDSGKKLGVRRIRGGRTYVRAALSMAALNAIKYCSPLKMFYERLREKGKSFKVAIVAVMRKLITILNVMVKTNTCWQEQKTNCERN